MRNARGLLAAGAVALALSSAGDIGVAALGQLPGARQLPAAPESLSRYLPPSATSAAAAIEQRFDERAAMALVEFMDRYWRNAANEGFNASIDRIRERLVESGYGRRASGPAGWRYSSR